MDQDTLNMSIRKFLKKVGVTSQREIEGAIRDALESGKLSGSESLPVNVQLTIGDVGLDVAIGGEIALE
ncbi:MAG: hypothetical protein GY791_16165 [Alphaproteobacteria bacterium]|nr:hypothetical protein [Alphaproteobacteria bacterium]